MTELLSSGRIKAVFLDYTGTMVKEDEPYTRALLHYFLTNSELNEPEKALRVVWGMIRQLEASCYGDSFIKKDEMVDRILQMCTEQYGLKGDLDYMHETWRNSWIHAPLFDDAAAFFERVQLPVYVVTNDDLSYIEESMRLKKLKPAGIAAAEMVRACKPHREIFEKALEMAGVSPQEAVHIGDSLTSDVPPAKELSIQPVLIDRKGIVSAGEDDLIVIRSLMDFF